MRIEFTARAIADLDHIHDRVAVDRPKAAVSVLAQIRDAAALLTDFRYGARAGTIRGTRELVVRGLPYLLIYRVDEARGAVLVVRVLHAKQDRKRHRP